MEELTNTKTENITITSKALQNTNINNSIINPSIDSSGQSITIVSRITQHQISVNDNSNFKPETIENIQLYDEALSVQIYQQVFSESDIQNISLQNIVFSSQQHKVQNNPNKFQRKRTYMQNNKIQKKIDRQNKLSQFNCTQICLANCINKDNYVSDINSSMLYNVYEPFIINSKGNLKSSFNILQENEKGKTSLQIIKQQNQFQMKLINKKCSFQQLKSKQESLRQQRQLKRYIDYKQLQQQGQYYELDVGNVRLDFGKYNKFTSIDKLSLQVIPIQRQINKQNKYQQNDYYLNRYTLTLKIDCQNIQQLLNILDQTNSPLLDDQQQKQLLYQYYQQQQQEQYINSQQSFQYQNHQYDNNNYSLNKQLLQQNNQLYSYKNIQLLSCKNSQNSLSQDKYQIISMLNNVQIKSHKSFIIQQNQEKIHNKQQKINYQTQQKRSQSQQINYLSQQRSHLLNQKCSQSQQKCQLSQQRGYLLNQKGSQSQQINYLSQQRSHLLNQKGSQSQQNGSQSQQKSYLSQQRSYLVNQKDNSVKIKNINILQNKLKTQWQQNQLSQYIMAYNYLRNQIVQQQIIQKIYKIQIEYLDNHRNKQTDIKQLMTTRQWQMRQNELFIQFFIVNRIIFQQLKMPSCNVFRILSNKLGTRSLKLCYRKYQYILTKYKNKVNTYQQLLAQLIRMYNIDMIKVSKQVNKTLQQISNSKQKNIIRIYDKQLKLYQGDNYRYNKSKYQHIVNNMKSNTIVLKLSTSKQSNLPITFGQLITNRNHKNNTKNKYTKNNNKSKSKSKSKYQIKSNNHNKSKSNNSKSKYKLNQ